jgi:asparagine synthase (glutamine-hydrolysing)
MRDRIPESVRTRVDKMGFPTPTRRWLAHDLHEPARALLEDPALRERGIYDVDAIRRDLERHRKGEIDRGAALFDVIQFETWYRQSIREGVR